MLLRRDGSQRALVLKASTDKLSATAIRSWWSTRHDGHPWADPSATSLARLSVCSSVHIIQNVCKIACYVGSWSVEPATARPACSAWP